MKKTLSTQSSVKPPKPIPLNSWYAYITKEVNKSVGVKKEVNGK